MSGRVELDITLRYDPVEPVGGVFPLLGYANRPVIVVRNLQTVDELYLGHLVATLLGDAAMEQEAER